MSWFPALPNSYVKILTLKVIELGGVAFGRSLGHEGGALMNGIRALMRREGRDDLSPLRENTARR